MTARPFYKSKHVAIPLAGLAVNTILGETLVYINNGRLLPLVAVRQYLTEAWPIILQTIALFYLVYYTVNYFNKKYASAPNSISRFLQEILFVSIAGFIVQEIFRFLFIKYTVVAESPATLNPKLRQLQMMSMTFLLVIYAMVTSFRIFQYLQQKQLELVQWQREYTQSQFEGLKNQLNPHFLFNSLSILTSLVYTDADKAEEFIGKLSKSYRYLLEQKDKEKVPLKKEMEFFEGYKYLVEQRFGKKLQFKVQVNETELNKELPPHSLMIALEYIIANNAMSAAKPLVVELSTEDNDLLINYCCQAKSQIEGNSEKQLMTLKERYSYLLPERPMQIISHGETSTILYPLL
ncbi:sensor histidine kinase [Segetibacter koreensis]|uniref:sensor histidine kinase n=1 Tax=Segetibacter koreensis TaxID=398037 RepID=UPI000366C268|nr:histidine kinase [Segetibacter koreensis]